MKNVDINNSLSSRVFDDVMIIIQTKFNVAAEYVFYIVVK